MKKFLSAVLFCCLFFCGCVPKQPLDSAFLPTALGIAQGSDTAFSLTAGGYIPSKTSDGSPEYSVREFPCDRITQIFEQDDLSLGTLSVLAVSLQQAQYGLYPHYTPFIYNDDATEGMYLILCEDPAQLLQAPAQDTRELHSYLQEHDFPTPSIIGYDISMRTPGEGLVLPVVSQDADGHYQILRAAAFQSDNLCGYLTQETFPYIDLLNRRKVQLYIPYQIQGYDNGQVRMELQCDVSLELKDAQDFIFHITVFADGVLAARQQLHEDIRMQNDDTKRIEDVVAQTIKENCLMTIAQAQACSCDIFGFTRLILATDRSYSETALTDAFENSAYQIQVQTTVRNLTQIH